MVGGRGGKGGAGGELPERKTEIVDDFGILFLVGGERRGFCSMWVERKKEESE